MKKIIINVVMIVSLLILIASVSMAAITDVYDQGQVDWEQGVIRVTGQGVAPEGITGEAQAQLLATRAAKVDAMRNALEVVENVRVSSSTTMEMLMVTSDQVNTQVQGYIKGGQFETPTFDPKGICTITFVLPLSGQNSLSALMLNTVKSRVPSSSNDNLASNQTKPTVSTGNQSLSTVTYSGIIIDARTIGIKPALYPQIFDPDGILLYGPTMVNTQQTDFTTMVAYARSLEKARDLSRVGTNPLKITAASSVKAANGETTDIVIGSEAAKSFREAVKQSDILAKSAIVVVIN